MKRIIIAILLFSFVVIKAQTEEVFTIGSISAGPGEKVSGKLIVKEGIDQGTFIPISIINGENPGPVFSLTAGIHGTEYVPVIALQQLIDEIDTEDLSGTVILVHVANIPAFLNRSVYIGPIDQKNLNRVFPGDENGSITERIAFTITNEIFSISDYYIDLHGGEFHESLLNFLYFFSACPDNDLCEKSKMMAHAMGNNYLFPFKYDTFHDSLPSLYAFYEAYRQGAASILAEFGDQGKVDSEDLELARNGVLNVMRTIGMLEGDIFSNQHPNYLKENLRFKSNYDGIFHSSIDKGLSVSKGTLLGYTSDYWGNILEEYRSPFSGIVVRTTASPLVKTGEVVVYIATLSDTFESE